MDRDHAVSAAAESPMVEIDRHKLRRSRQMAGLSQAQLAQDAGISFGYLGHLERGTRPRVSPGVLASLCKALEIEDRSELLSAEVVAS